MKDIQSREDIDMLVKSFYDKLMVDKHIGHFFNEAIDLDLEEHLPIISNFWDSMLLGAQNYQGNPMQKHIALNKAAAMEESHFDRWLQHWEQTISAHFSGPKADEAVSRAKQIAQLMLFKVQQS